MRQDVWMMHDCPKCGFHQPIDRYCANCGLDIDSYVPAPEPLVQKLRKNIVVKIGLVILIVTAVAVLVLVNQMQKIEDHFNFISQNVSNLKVSKKDTEPLQSDESLSLNDKLVAQKKSASLLASSSPIQTVNDRAVNEAPKELYITFAEASKPLLMQLASEGQILDETAQTRSFLNSTITDVAKLSERDAAFLILPAKDQKTLRINIPLLMDFMHLSGEENEDIGLSIRILPTAVSETGVDLEFEGLLNLKSESGQAIASQEIRGNYSFKPQSTLVMVGFLPRQPIRTEDLDSFSNTPLVIFESLQFMNGTTDFVIFIQAK